MAVRSSAPSEAMKKGGDDERAIGCPENGSYSVLIRFWGNGAELLCKVSTRGLHAVGMQP